MSIRLAELACSTARILRDIHNPESAQGRRNDYRFSDFFVLRRNKNYYLISSFFSHALRDASPYVYAAPRADSKPRDEAL